MVFEVVGEVLEEVAAAVDVRGLGMLLGGLRGWVKDVGFVAGK